MSKIAIYIYVIVTALHFLDFFTKKLSIRDYSIYNIFVNAVKRKTFVNIVAYDEKLSIFYLHFRRCTAYATPYYLHFILFCISELLNLGKGIKVKSRIKL